jgi:hypothetical protein
MTLLELLNYPSILDLHKLDKVIELYKAVELSNNSLGVVVYLYIPKNIKLEDNVFTINKPNPYFLEYNILCFGNCYLDLGKLNLCLDFVPDIFYKNDYINYTNIYNPINKYLYIDNKYIKI